MSYLLQVHVIDLNPVYPFTVLHVPFWVNGRRSRQGSRMEFHETDSDTPEGFFRVALIV